MLAVDHLVAKIDPKHPKKGQKWPKTGTLGATSLKNFAKFFYIALRFYNGSRTGEEEDVYAKSKKNFNLAET